MVARALHAEQVPFIFTLCGGHVMPIYDGCVDEGIGVIDVRHEQTAAHAADGWARVTGRPSASRRRPTALPWSFRRAVAASQSRPSAI